MGEILGLSQALTAADWVHELAGPGFNWSAETWRDGVRQGRVFGEARPEPRVLILYQELGPETLEILAVISHPQSQRRGMMRQLMNDFFNHYNSLKKEVWLEVHHENAPALRLYESLGFQETGRRPHYYGPGGTAVLMTKTLPSL